MNYNRAITIRSDQMSTGISMYTYMWISEDVKNILGKKVSKDLSTFEKDSVCGVLTLFIRTVGPVLKNRARINDAQEFYSSHAKEIKSIVDNLDYDVLSKDSAMVEQVKFVTNSIDKYNSQFDEITDDMQQYLELTDQYIADMYSAHLAIIAVMPRQLADITNNALKAHTDFEVEIDDFTLSSYADVKDAVFRQIGGKTLTFWNKITEYIDENNFDDVAKFHLVYCFFHILDYLSKNTLSSGNTQKVDELDKVFVALIKNLAKDLMPLLKILNSKYQVVNSDDIEKSLDRIEKNEKPYFDFIQMSKHFPIKNDPNKDKSVDLDSVIRHLNKSN